MISFLVRGADESSIPTETNDGYAYLALMKNVIILSTSISV